MIDPDLFNDKNKSGKTYFSHVTITFLHTNLII